MSCFDWIFEKNLGTMIGYMKFKNFQLKPLPPVSVSCEDPAWNLHHGGFGGAKTREELWMT